MQGPIAQIVALTSWGNAILRSAPGVDARLFASENIGFAFCEFVRFVSLSGGAPEWIETPYAEDPASWFAQLKRDGVSGLRIWHHSPGTETVGDQKVAERMLVGFVGGGGRWLMEARKGSTSDLWEGKWELGDRTRPDRKIWQVSYGRIVEDGEPMEGDSGSLNALAAELGECLTAIGAFARSQEYYNFAECFEAGLAALTAGGESADSSTSLVPPTAPAEARRLLNAVEAAWVFGGMGSWNDIGFDGEDQNRYEALSEQLYGLLNRATVAAANA